MQREYYGRGDKLPKGWSRLIPGHRWGAGASKDAASKEWRTWMNMILRVLTNCPLRNANKNYATKKIQKEFADFPYWLAVMGPAPGPEYSIDRIDPEGHYEEGNIRWATRIEQANNKCRKKK